MVLPEPSRKMAYTTRNTVNRLARKVNHVVLELSKEKEAYTSSSRTLLWNSLPESTRKIK